MLKIKNQLNFMKNEGNYLQNKTGLITIRDLIKWSNRKEYMISKEEIAYEGFTLLAERMRDHFQKKLLKEIIAKEAKIKNFNISKIYQRKFEEFSKTRSLD